MNTRTICFLSAAILCGAAVTACTTRRAPKFMLLTPEEQETFFSRAQDERRFWLTRYESPYGPVFSGGHRLHTDRQAHIPFGTRRQSTVPGMAARLRSPTESLALIDTSSRGNWIEFGLAIEQGLIPIGPPPHRMFAAHVNDPVPGYLSVSSRMVIDQLFIDAALFYVKGAHGPMAELLRNEPDLSAPMILGADFIRAFHFVRIDFPNRMISLSTTIPYRLDSERLIASVPMLDHEGVPAVEGFLDTLHTLFLFDSLGDFHVAADLVETTHVRQIMIDDLVMRNVPVTDIQTTSLGMPKIPRLGRQILAKFIITFDNHQRLIHFERP